jgi:hypothetical protein
MISDLWNVLCCDVVKNYDYRCALQCLLRSVRLVLPIFIVKTFVPVRSL